jgi:hypothetical protein
LVDGHASAGRAAVRSYRTGAWREVHGTTVDHHGRWCGRVGPVAPRAALGEPVRNLTLRTTTLDDVFLELTGNHIRAADPDSDQRDLEVAS